MTPEPLRHEVPSWPSDDVTAQWVSTVAVGDTLERPAGQSGQALCEILEDLSVPHRDIDAVLRVDADLDRYPHLSELRHRSAAVLLRDLGREAVAHPFPTFAGAEEDRLRYFWVLVLADLQPYVTSWHAQQGIDAEVSRRTLADLGRHMSHNRLRLGYGGLTLNLGWLWLHFQGRLFQLGRLQFEMAELDRSTAAEIVASGGRATAGDPALAVHIPDYCGPFTPQDCRASFDAAAAFFPQHFPDFTGEFYTCDSWLLDRGLPAYLSPTSNIVQFQRFFTIANPEQTNQDQTENDASVFTFVFGTPDTSDLAALPQDTSLQRALVTHLREGHHWYGGVGWRPATQPSPDRRE